MTSTASTSTTVQYAPPRSAYTVAQFCLEHGIGRTQYFALQKAHAGPRTYKVGARTYISAEAAAEWRAERERLSAEPAAPRVGAEPRKRPTFLKPPPSSNQ